MSRTLISATDVQQAVACGYLKVPADAIITPLARDVAAERGLTITRCSEATSSDTSSTPVEKSDELTTKVRAIVASLLGSGGGESLAPTSARPPVKLNKLADARLAPFPYPGPPADMAVNTLDVVTEADSAPIAAGYMTITKGSFPWTLTYDEVQIVLEGELHLGGDAGGKIGRPGDVLFVPKGSSITFGTPSWAKFVYVTFPANWEDNLK